MNCWHDKPCTLMPLLSKITITWEQALRHQDSLITKMAKWPTGGISCSKGWFTTRWDRPVGMRFHHTTQNSKQLKTCELLISRIFHFIFLDQSQPRISETSKSKTSNNKDYCSNKVEKACPSGNGTGRLISRNRNQTLNCLSPHHTHFLTAKLISHKLLIVPFYLDVVLNT